MLDVIPRQKFGLADIEIPNRKSGLCATFHPKFHPDVTSLI
jgi:hypothetical protein